MVPIEINFFVSFFCQSVINIHIFGAITFKILHFFPSSIANNFDKNFFKTFHAAIKKEQKVA